MDVEQVVTELLPDKRNNIKLPCEQTIRELNQILKITDLDIESQVQQDYLWSLSLKRETNNGNLLVAMTFWLESISNCSTGGK